MKRIEAKSSLENLVDALQDQLNDKEDLGGKLESDDMETIAEAIKEKQKSTPTPAAPPLAASASVSLPPLPQSPAPAAAGASVVDEEVFALSAGAAAGMAAGVDVAQNAEEHLEEAL